MKFNELEVGQRVMDTWFPDWGTGKVITLFKTVVYIQYPGSRPAVKYDKPHVKFLTREIY